MVSNTQVCKIQAYKVVARIDGELYSCVLIDRNPGRAYRYTTNKAVFSALCFQTFKQAWDFVATYSISYYHGCSWECWLVEGENPVEIKYVIDPSLVDKYIMTQLSDKHDEVVIYQIPDHNTEHTAPVGSTLLQNVKLIRPVSEEVLNGTPRIPSTST